MSSGGNNRNSLNSSMIKDTKTKTLYDMNGKKIQVVSNSNDVEIDISSQIFKKKTGEIKSKLQNSIPNLEYLRIKKDR